jgi:hypothetical protein
MNENLIQAVHKSAIYKLKPDTSTSYYYQVGELILPNRIGISNEFQFAEANKSGRNQHPIAGQIKATFKLKEESKYKQNKPFNIHTNIWKVAEYPIFIGYGSIGITNEAGRITETGDLIILYSRSASWQEVEVHFFPGMLMQLDSMFEYLYKLKRCNP